MPTANISYVIARLVRTGPRTGSQPPTPPHPTAPLLLLLLLSLHRASHFCYFVCSIVDDSFTRRR